MNNLDKTYIALLQDILDNGVEKKDRTGTGTLSVFGRQIRHKMSEGFPLLTTKKMPFKTVVTELIWFLRGDTNIKYLVDNNCHIWDGDAYKNYEKKALDVIGETEKDKLLSQEEFIEKIKIDDEFAKKWGELGPIYGKQWRSWNTPEKCKSGDLVEWPNDDRLQWPKIVYKPIDQIQNLINDLKTNPDSRRLMVNAWNVGELDQMVLPPCHYGFQVYTRELSNEERLDWMKKNRPKIGLPMREFDVEFSMDEFFRPYGVPKRAISLMWNQRSVDTFLGLPFNIASYGLLLMMIADEVNMIPDELIGNLGDVHLYSNHIEQAKEQIGRNYTHEERHDMLKTAMGDFYSTAVSEMVPFGGGLSEYYDSYKIPKKTREPFPLPTVHVRDGIFSSSINDFILSDYQSHETIKAPLSN